MKPYIKVPSKKDPNVTLKVIHGHFATPHSHITCYMDVTTMKSRISEAQGVAEMLAMRYSSSTPVDSIVCLNGTEVIGTFLAQALTRAGVISYNAHKTIYIVSPEYTSYDQIIFRDNIQMAVRGKHVLILTDSITTGIAVSTAIECLKYYGSSITGVSAIFSVATSVAGLDINSAFTPADIPEYASYKHTNCPLCSNGTPLDALVNNYGYSEL